MAPITDTVFATAAFAVTQPDGTHHVIGMGDRFDPDDPVVKQCPGYFASDLPRRPDDRPRVRRDGH